MKSCIDLGITCDVCPLYLRECFPPARFYRPADTEASEASTASSDAATDDTGTSS